MGLDGLHHASSNWRTVRAHGLSRSRMVHLIECIEDGGPTERSQRPSLVRFRMLSALNLLSFVIASLAGWLSEHQQRSIEYFVEENRILREQIGDRKLRFTTSPSCRSSQGIEPQRPEQNCNHRHSGNSVGMASEAHRKQVRWKRHAQIPASKSNSLLATDAYPPSNEKQFCSQVVETGGSGRRFRLQKQLQPFSERVRNGL